MNSTGGNQESNEMKPSEKSGEDIVINTVKCLSHARRAAYHCPKMSTLPHARRAARADLGCKTA